MAREGWKKYESKEGDLKHLKKKIIEYGSNPEQPRKNYKKRGLTDLNII
jgi:hypothetical protein